MKSLRDVLGIDKQIDSPDKKRDFNERHFTEAASCYDIATRAMSLGRDQAWKKFLVAALPELPEPICVDLASGIRQNDIDGVHRQPAGHCLYEDQWACDRSRRDIA